VWQIRQSRRKNLIQRNNAYPSTSQYGDMPLPWQWENACLKHTVGRNRALQKYNRVMDL
jgi:hypothetical protein